MHRQQVTSEEIAQETLVLAGPAAHHLLHVLRVREGDEVGAFDGAGATRLYHVAVFIGCRYVSVHPVRHQPALAPRVNIEFERRRAAAQRVVYDLFERVFKIRLR